MKRMSIGMTAVASLLATSAFAADWPMPTYAKAPVYAEPVFNWTGFYLGGNIGYSWGRSSNTSTLTNSAGTLLFSSTDKGAALNGVFGGGQIGYNWQLQNLVWGLEADIQGTKEMGSRSFVCPVGVCIPTPVGVPAAAGTPVPAVLGQKIDWLGTVRGRAGVAVTPTLLLYATGGLAYGEVNTNESIGVIPSAFSSNATNAGWTAGGGIEGAIGGNWTARVEYLYVDLGKVNGSFITPLTAVGGGVIATNYSSHITDNIVRVGINYKFNGPVFAKY